MNWELPDVHAGFRKGRGLKKKKKKRKGRGTRNQIANICYIIEKARVFHKSINFIDYAKAFDCEYHNKLQILKTWEYQTTLPVSWEICM